MGRGRSIIEEVVREGQNLVFRIARSTGRLDELIGVFGTFRLAALFKQLQKSHDLVAILRVSLCQKL